MHKLLSRVNLHHLMVFRMVARKLSYSRAAEELMISQPAVSRHVHALEQEVGAQLMGQSGNRAYLTDAGRVVQSYAERVAETTLEMERALAELNDPGIGMLRLGASSTPGAYMLPSVIAVFRQRYPGIDLTLQIETSQKVAEMVGEGQVDLGVVGANYVGQFQVHPYAKDEIAFVVGKQHPCAQSLEIATDEIDTLALVVREQGSGTRDTVERALAQADVKPRSLLELRGDEAVKHAVAAGLGVGAVSARSANIELRYGDLLRLRVPGLDLQRDLYIISRKGSRPTASALTFIGLASKMVQSDPENQL